MNSDSGMNGARRPVAVAQLREQVDKDRRELAETVTALHDKTDVKRRVRNKAAGAEVAVADLAAWAGRTAGTVPRLLSQAKTTASDRVHNSPKPVRAPLEQAAGLVRSPLRVFPAMVAGIIAVVAARRRIGR